MKYIKTLTEIEVIFKNKNITRQIIHDKNLHYKEGEFLTGKNIETWTHLSPPPRV